MLNIAVCDDDISDMNDAIRMIDDVMPGFEIEYSIDGYSDADELLRSGTAYHIVLLDVEMGELSGIEAAEEIHRRDRDALIFFVTNHEDYMDEALNKHAFRFWTKPMNRTRLIYAVKSALLEIGGRAEEIAIPLGKETVNIAAREIICVYHQLRKTYIITAKGSIETYAPYRSVADKLTGSYFLSTDRSCIVNLNYVSEYTKGEVICRYNGKTFKAPLSRRRYKGVDAKFKKWSGDMR